MTKVIVVDDDPTNISLLKMLLELDGFTVDSCSDVAEAIAAATNDVDAFVVDVNLARGKIGLDLLKAIRNSETAVSPDTIVIMTSGDVRREEESLAVGANLFLLKPYSPSTLSVEINKLMGRGK